MTVLSMTKLGPTENPHSPCKPEWSMDSPVENHPEPGWKGSISPTKNWLGIREIQWERQKDVGDLEVASLSMPCFVHDGFWFFVCAHEHKNKHGFPNKHTKFVCLKKKNKKVGKDEEEYTLPHTYLLPCPRSLLGFLPTRFMACSSEGSNGRAHISPHCDSVVCI